MRLVPTRDFILSIKLAQVCLNLQPFFCVLQAFRSHGRAALPIIRQLDKAVNYTGTEPPPDPNKRVLPGDLTIRWVKLSFFCNICWNLTTNAFLLEGMMLKEGLMQSYHSN
jgi:hypothetical protein